MVKAEILREVSRATGCQLTDVAAVIDKFMETIKAAVADKEAVILRGFGTFQYTHVPARKARDIGRNTIIEIPAHGDVKFKPSRIFKNEVKQS